MSTATTELPGRLGHYDEKVVFDPVNYHSAAIRCIAFSPDGSLLATGADDCNLNIWNIKTGKLEYQLEGYSRVLSISWIPNSFSLLAGYADNLLLQVTIAHSEMRVRVSGVYYSSPTNMRSCFPVELLAVQDKQDPLLVIGGRNSVVLWHYQFNEWSSSCKLKDPPGIATSSPIVVTGLKWSSPSTLFVSYMYHGVVCWDVAAMSLVFAVPISSPVARMDLNLDMNTLAVHDMRQHVDLWDASRGVKIRRFLLSEKKPAEPSIPLHIAFIHQGNALLSGDLEGVVKVWDVDSGDQICTLIHPLNEPIQAVAALYLPGQDKFMIATGATVPSRNKYKVHLWETGVGSGLKLLPSMETVVDQSSHLLSSGPIKVGLVDIGSINRKTFYATIFVAVFYKLLLYVLE